MSAELSEATLTIDGVQVYLADIKKMIQPGRKMYRPFVDNGELRLIEFDERHKIWFDEDERFREK